MKEHTKAYVAGLLDAEGCFTIVKQTTELQDHYHPRLILVSTFRPVIEWMVDNFGGVLYHKKLQPPRQDAYHWKTNSKEQTCKFISLVLPYLKLKKDEAATLLEFCSLPSKKLIEERERLYQKIRQQKKRESVTTETQDFSLKNSLANAYFAGFFDGEGCISLSRNGKYVAPLKAAVGNTDKAILLEMQKRYGGRFYEKKLSNLPLHSPVFYWELQQSEQLEQFLLAVLPHLIIKRKPAMTGLELKRLGNTADPLQREKYYVALNNMNANNGKKIQSPLRSDVQCVPVGTQTTEL